MPRHLQRKFQENLKSTVVGFHKLQEVFNVFSKAELQSNLLREMSAGVPNLDSAFTALEVLFALETNEDGSILHFYYILCTSLLWFINIIPAAGQDEDFDQVREETEQANKNIDNYLEVQRKKLGVKKVR